MWVRWISGQIPKRVWEGLRLRGLTLCGWRWSGLGQTKWLNLTPLHNSSFDLTSEAWGWTRGPLLLCLRAQVARPMPVVKYIPLGRRTRVLCVCVSVWIMYLHVYMFVLYVRKYIHVCSYTGALAYVCQCVFVCILGNLWKEGGKRGSAEDGNKIKLFYRFRVGACCLSNFVSFPHLFQHWCLGVLD